MTCSNVLSTPCLWTITLGVLSLEGSLCTRGVSSEGHKPIFFPKAFSNTAVNYVSGWFKIDECKNERMELAIKMYILTPKFMFLIIELDV